MLHNMKNNIFIIIVMLTDVRVEILDRTPINMTSLWVLLKRGTENGTEWKTERNESFQGKQNIIMNFVDSTAYKGKRFEIKQNL